MDVALIQVHKANRDRERIGGCIPVGLASNGAVGNLAQRTVRGPADFSEHRAEFSEDSTVGFVDTDQFDGSAIHAFSVDRASRLAPWAPIAANRLAPWLR